MCLLQLSACGCDIRNNHDRCRTKQVFVTKKARKIIWKHFRMDANHPSRCSRAAVWLIVDMLAMPLALAVVVTGVRAPALLSQLIGVRRCHIHQS